MALEISVRTDGMPRTLAVLKDVERATGDLRPAFRQIDAHVIQPFFRRHFETAGKHGGTPWRPISAATIRSRTYKRGGPSSLRGPRKLAIRADFPLWFTGALKESLEGPTALSIRIFDKQRYERGTRRQGAYAHQEGRGVPKRQIVPEPLPAFLVNQIEGVAAKHVEGR